MAHSQDKVQNILYLHKQGYASRHIAKVVLGSKTKKSTVNYIIQRYKKEEPKKHFSEKISDSRVYVIDIETTMIPSYVFRSGKTFISHDALLDEPRISCVAVKRVGVDGAVRTKTWDYKKQCDRELCKWLSGVIENAQLIVGHNFHNYDKRFINARMLCNCLPPIKKYNVFDTYKEARKVFNLPNYKLDYLANILLGEGKDDSGGLQGFIEVTQGDKKALDTMLSYNIKDVLINEKVFLKMLPYTDSVNNLSHILSCSRDNCSKCGSYHIEHKDYIFTRRGKYKMYQCNDCESWTQGSHNQLNVKNLDKF